MLGRRPLRRASARIRKRIGDDLSRPIDARAVGAALASYGFGFAGAGASSVTSSDEGITAASVHSYEREGGQLQFIFGEATPGALTVGNGDFVLYGVQEGQVVSAIKGTASGDGAAAHSASAMVQANSIPGFPLRDTVVGFAAEGFSVRFEPQPLPAAA